MFSTSFLRWEASLILNVSLFAAALIATFYESRFAVRFEKQA
jgi:hypothetical protein